MGVKEGVGLIADPHAVQGNDALLELNHILSNF
jgi:hypothetical protein